MRSNIDLGMVALAGTADMRAIATRFEAGDAAAVAAINVYLHRLVAGIAGMAAALRGLDALVFTGGVGENSALVRSLTAERLGWLGVAVDEASSTGTPAALDFDVSALDATVRTLVIAAREDLQIAAEVRALPLA